MIQLINIQKTFNEGSETAICAINNISLNIELNTWCNLIGPNGSGKSTLMRIIAGEYFPTSGEILVDDEDISNWDQRQRTKFFYFGEQDTTANLVPSMTIAENLLLSLEMNRFPSLKFLKTKDNMDKIYETLTYVQMGLEDRLSTQVRFLSGGQRQAVVLAKALLTNAKILLLDEFLGAIDPKTGPFLLDIIKDMAKKRQLTVIMISHELEHVLQAKGRVVVLSQGKIYADLSEEKTLFSKESLIKLYQSAIEESGKI